MKCYIKLQIQPKTVSKRLQKYKYILHDYYIVGGAYIMPMAKSLLENENIIIDSYLLDTTWRIMPYYVTSILTACFYNTSVPIAYSFGHNETKDSYSYLLKTAESQIDVTFRGKIFESDQGSSLKSLFNEWGIFHLAGIRHFLHNLKKFDSFFELQNIIKSATEFELDNSCNEFSREIKEIIEQNPKELTNINRSPKKIGHKFQNDKVEKVDDTKWDKVTMLNRVKYHMPTTTNSLESIHRAEMDQISIDNCFLF